MDFNNEKKSTWPLWTGIACGVVFLIWMLLVVKKAGFIAGFDQALINGLAGKSAGAIAFARTFTNLGNTSTILVITVVAFALLLWRKHRAAAFFLAISEFFTAGCNFVVKHLVKRARPSVRHLVEAHGYSFPSGHSASSMTVFICLLIIAYFLIKNNKWRWTAMIAALLVPFIIGWTRITVHVHFPSDVLGGFLEGLTFVFLAFYFFKPALTRHIQR